MMMSMIRWCVSTLFSVVPICLRQKDDLKLTHRLGGTFLSCLLAVIFGGTAITSLYAFSLAFLALFVPNANKGHDENEVHDENDDRDEDDFLVAVFLNSILIVGLIVGFGFGLREVEKVVFAFFIPFLLLYPFYLLYCKIWLHRGMADPATVLYAFCAAIQMAGLFEALAISRS